MWEKDGNVPEIRWMVNAGNTRREDTQALMIPVLQAGRLQRRRRQLRRRLRVPAAAARAGLRPGDVHQHRLAGPDGHRHHGLRARCPSDENGNRVRTPPAGATRTPSTLMPESDQELDETKRVPTDPPDRPVPGRRRGHAAAVPVPEHRRLAHRQARAARSTPTPPTTRRSRTSTSGSRPMAVTRSSSVPSSGRSASTRSPSAPTRRGSSGPHRSWCSRRVDTTGEGNYEPTALRGRRADGRVLG